MTRIEENMAVVKEINKMAEEVESMPINSNEAMVVQVSIIATTLMDISKSLAVIADNKGGRE